jgi:cytochrome c556
MSRPARTLARLALVSMTVLPMAAGADSQDAIDYRQHIMNTLNEQSAALGMILSGSAPDDNAVKHLEVIALTAQMALKSFEPQVPGGESKPEVWANWPDFSRRMNEFAQKMSELAKTAEEKGKDAALKNVLDSLTCKACHDVYREKKH